jgi:hypothetical protein
MDGMIGERDVSKCCRWEGRWKENVKADDAGGGLAKGDAWTGIASRGDGRRR